jgi:hypothetical protein
VTSRRGSDRSYADFALNLRHSASTRNHIGVLRGASDHNHHPQDHA